MSNLKSILKSFHLRDELNPKIWKEKGGDIIINPKVRNRLLEISNEFIEFLKVDFNAAQLPLYEELFKLKKTLFNDKHDITIFGYDVELYVQDESETHFSSGVFSVLKNEWITKPKKENPKIDTELIKNKSEQWMKIIDGVIESAKGEPLDDARKLIDKYKDKIKKYRTCGLEKGGEYSDENLVFKVLRRNNYIQKLFDFETKHTDKELSLKEATTNIGGTFKTDLENGPRNHGGRALGNWESDNAWDIFSPPGTVVNSYTDGVVSRIRDTGKNSGKIFGTQVSISGDNNFPDIFYTHLKNVNLKKGDSVKVGDYIGVISEWVGHEGMEHVHIGLPRGRHLRELLVNSDKIFTGKGETSEPSTTEKTDPVDNTTVNTSIVSSLQDLLNKSEFTSVNKDEVNKNLSEIESGENKIMKEFYDLLSSGKEYKNLKGVESSIPVERGVELIQTGLQFLGFLLPKWGVDGKFGPETEQAVKEFQQKYGLTETGVLNKEDLTKLFSILTIKNFKDSNMSGIEIEGNPDTSNISTGDVQLVGNFDAVQKNNIKLMIDYMNKTGITDPLAQIGILSVISKESGFKPKSEVSYAGTSNSRIRSIFGSRVAKYSDSELNDLKSDPEKFFNVVYAKTVGNQGGGDGWRYRGRGFNQLTGKKNYEKYGNMIGKDLVGNPDLVNEPDIAAQVAVAFFTKGKPASTFPKFKDKVDAATYFADINAGGGVSSHRSNAIAASEKFDVATNIA